mmetsp:Transcript_86626/g.223109  ORF Transcript_86626/g.223109 Transcript_86626/m.223109 type:complete len:169 (+) Transcript_86626:112-618(+)
MGASRMAHGSGCRSRWSSQWTARRMAPNQRTELTLPAGADLAMLCEPELSPGAPSAALTLEVELCTFRARRIRPGNGERPSPGCLAAAKLWDGQLRGSGPFPMPRVVKLTLGSGDFIPGLEAAVSQMSLGEVAEITIPPLGAYGATGCFAAVPPNATLQVSVELLGFD